MATIKQLRIEVSEYPSGRFLGYRFAPYRIFEYGEKIISNHDEINSQVDEVRKLNNLKKENVSFKTDMVE